MSGQAKKRLGELLIEAGVIDETQLKSALGHQRQWGVRIGQALVDLKLATEQDVVKVLAKKFGLEMARLDQVEAYGHQQALALVPREFAAQHNVFPLSADSSTLAVAMSDPTNLSVVDELRFRSGRRVKVTIGGDREIASAVKAAYPSADGEVEAIALEIDESSATGESVIGSFGGGSSDDFVSFFGADAGRAGALPGAAPADDPFTAEPATAPPAAPAVPQGPPAQLGPSPTQAPLPAPFPVSLGTPAAGPVPAAALPRPGSAPVAGPPVAPRLAPVGPPRPAAAARAPAAPGQAAPPPAAFRGGAPTVPAMRAVPPPAGPPPQVLQPAGPPRPTAPRPAAPPQAARPPVAPPPSAPQRPVQRPHGSAAAQHPLEALLSPSAVQAASALRAQAAAPPAPPAAAPPAAVAELEEELSPLPDEALEPEPPAAGALSPGEQAVLDALERLADGGHAEPEVLKPAQAIAVLIRILVRKGIVDQRELLDALRRDRED